MFKSHVAPGFWAYRGRWFGTGNAKHKGWFSLMGKISEQGKCSRYNLKLKVLIGVVKRNTFALVESGCMVSQRTLEYRYLACMDMPSDWGVSKIGPEAITAIYFKQSSLANGQKS